MKTKFSISWKITKEQVKGLIAKIDSNGDGKLSVEECIKASQSH